MSDNEFPRAITLNGSTDQGVLIIHGFTSTPQSVSYIAERFGDAGYHVEVPVLSGHNTQWQDMDRVHYQDWINDTQAALARLEKRAERLFVFGLSMGGTLALRLAQTHHNLRAVSVVNHAVYVENALVPFIPLLHFLKPWAPAISGDIKDPDAREIAYEKVSSLAVYQLFQLCRLTRRHLGDIRCPVQIFKSHQDHVLSKKNVHTTLKRLRVSLTDMVWLEDSYHVATLDYDKARIAEECLAFFRERENYGQV